VCAAPYAKVSRRVSGGAACPWRLYYTRYYTPTPAASTSGYEDAGDENVDGLLLDDGLDPGQARLVAEDEESHPGDHADLVAHDAGIDGGTATAEEAAIHTVDDDDYDIRSGDWRHR
jgi:hypothetical protein